MDSKDNMDVEESKAAASSSAGPAEFVEVKDEWSDYPGIPIVKRRKTVSSTSAVLWQERAHDRDTGGEEIEDH